MENCGYSSPRSVAFPAGLRVLVVDDDPTWLKILEKMLIKCSYEVTTCGLAREALSLLRERKDRFDIIISDVNMPDMDGFKLLEHVGLEMDLPVIMMSVDGETSRVMKGVQHGACDYLLNPIRMKELRNIWQHVLRKRLHEIKDIENHDGHMEDRHFSSVTTDLTCVKKRKDLENKNDGRECNDYLSVKKTRVIWTVDLHQKFVKAVHLVGLDKVGPKKILDLMNIPWLTRENVASHLQKYRLYLSRLQKEKELKTSSFSRMKHRDFFSSKEHIVSQNLQNLTTMQQKESKNIDFKFLEGKGIGDDLKRETLDPQENSSSRMKFKNPFGLFDSKVKTIGNAENNNQHFLQSFNLVNLPTFQQNIKTECLQPVFFPKSRPSSIERQIIAEEENPPASFNSRTRNDLYSILPNTELLTIENTSKPNIIKSQRHDQIPVLDPRSNLSTMTDFATWCENQRVCSFDGDLHSLESLGSTGDSEHVRQETPACWMYDSLRFDSEYNPSDTMELSMVCNGLFII